MIRLRKDSLPRQALDILGAAGLIRPRYLALLFLYYMLTPLSAAADGLSWLLLVKLFAGSSALLAAGAAGPLALPEALTPTDPRRLMALVIVLFAFRSLLTVALVSLEDVSQAVVRRRIQERCFRLLLGGDWETLRHQNVGHWVGALTQEAVVFSKYVVSAVRSLYAVITFVILAGLAVALAPRMSVLLAAAGVPVWALLKFLYSRQALYSTRQTAERQGLSADVTERLAGLFQIKAAGDEEVHAAAGMRRQDEFTRMERLLGLFNGTTTSMNTIGLCVALGAYLAWSLWSGRDVRAELGAFGSVGILGFRAAAQLNTLVATTGNLTRLSGCVRPVHDLVSLPQAKAKKPLPEPLAEVVMDEVRYGYGARRVLDGLSLSVPAGRLFVVTGPSGAGKSTLANLVAGLVEPEAGRVDYVGPTGKRYPSTTYKPRIGYVTQDVHLLRGDVRANLDPAGTLSADELWRCLESAGAASFVRAMGGLEAPVSESGRSLSGGEKRRLAIARALAQQSDALILDEVTNGLDAANKKALVASIASLAARTVVIAITHDVEAFAEAAPPSLTLAPSVPPGGRA